MEPDPEGGERNRRMHAIALNRPPARQNARLGMDSSPTDVMTRETDLLRPDLD